VLSNLGSTRAFVVHGVGGLDEISTLGETQVTEVRDGEVTTYQLTPEELGLPRARPEDLSGSTPQENADLLVRVLEGEAGPARDIVVLNAAAAIAAGGRADTLPEALPLANESISSGAALGKLKQLQAF